MRYPTSATAPSSRRNASASLAVSVEALPNPARTPLAVVAPGSTTIARKKHPGEVRLDHLNGVRCTPSAGPEEEGRLLAKWCIATEPWPGAHFHCAEIPRIRQRMRLAPAGHWIIPAC